jgi:hypothetical protein
MSSLSVLEENAGSELKIAPRVADERDPAAALGSMQKGRP